MSKPTKTGYYKAQIEIPPMRGIWPATIYYDAERDLICTVERGAIIREWEPGCAPEIPRGKRTEPRMKPPC